MGGKETSTRLNDVVAIALEGLQVLLRGRMSVHVEVHGWSDEDGSLHGKISGDEHVVGNAVRHLADGGSRGRSNQHGIRPKTERHMGMPSAIALGEEFADDGFAGQC